MYNCYTRTKNFPIFSNEGVAVLLADTVVEAALLYYNWTTEARQGWLLLHFFSLAHFQASLVLMNLQYLNSLALQDYYNSSHFPLRTM
jgi:hypothetical protein